ncbi:MAG TPA: hypothetical protein VGE07_27535 [Herpetosiphonaceae bacterium]
MIPQLKAQLSNARRAQRAAQERAAPEADHQSWLASLRAHPRLQTRAAQDDARQRAALTPP